jgi:hypothetical protein
VLLSVALWTVENPLKPLVGLWLLVVTLPVFAVASAVPAEFVGEWVPVGSSCQAINRLRVEPTTVTLVNGPDSQKFENLDICHSCEGGARYGGMVVWLLPEFSKGAPAPFTVRFNANEEKGMTVVNIKRDDLKKRFPLHNMKLYKCKSKP